MATANSSTKGARELLWAVVDAVADTLRPPAPEPEPRVYPRVTIWKAGEQQAFGPLETLHVYPSPMYRILYRPFRYRDSALSYSVTFYFEDGAWSSILFDSKDEMNDALHSTVAGMLKWPNPEAI